MVDYDVLHALGEERPKKKRSRTPFIMGVIFLIFTVFFVSSLSAIRNTTAYTTGIEYVKGNEEIVTAVGGIERFGYFPEGSISYSDTGVDEAYFIVKVIGETKTINVHLRLYKYIDGEWFVSAYQLEGDSRFSIAV